MPPEPYILPPLRHERSVTAKGWLEAKIARLDAFLLRAAVSQKPWWQVILYWLLRRLVAVTKRFGRTFPWLYRPWYWLARLIRVMLNRSIYVTPRILFLRRLFGIKRPDDGHFRPSYSFVNWLTVLVFAFWFLPGFLVFLTDCGWYAFTAKIDETLYLSQGNEISPDKNVHSAMGCESLPCDPSQAVYFRITPTLFNHLWMMVHHGTLFYPDYIDAVIAPVYNKCTATSYGIREKILVQSMKGWDFYPELLYVQCQPLSNEDALRLEHSEK